MSEISVPVVAFIFVCIIYPRLVKHKPQFYMAFAVTLIILVLNIPIELAEKPLVGLAKVLSVLRAILWIGDFLLLVLATGGLSLHELTGELKDAYTVMRRGEDKPTLVIPKSAYADQMNPN